MLNDHEMSHNKDFSKEAWDYMRDNKFFAMKIPIEWGDLEFRTKSFACVLSKLASQCFHTNTTMAVPNLLGPGELLVGYGTPSQQEYFFTMVERRYSDSVLLFDWVLEPPNCRPFCH